MPVAVEADVRELLRELVAELKGLRADLAQSVDFSRRRENLPTSGGCTRVQVLSRADLALLGRLLPAIGGVFGSDEFAVRELFERDSAALRLVLSGLNGIRIGRLFQRAVDIPISSYLVERAGVELHAALWRVVGVPSVCNKT
jgi:hypothetical protein